MKLKLWVALLLATFSMSSFAGFMVEPYFGVGQYAQTFDLSALEDNEKSGESYTSVGGRLGYSFLLFSGGIDYEIMSVDDGSINNTSLFVGVDLPVLLRFYGKYVISSSLDLDDVDSSIDFKDGYAIGAGFTGLPFVVVNLEVGAYNYEFESNGFDIETGVATTLLTVSLPLP